MAKILIIEDDELIGRMYVKAFTKVGYEVQAAVEGRSGIETAKSFQPDLILCDVMMPEMNGIEVLSALKADESLKHIPVVMLTNLSGTQDAQTAKEKGAVDYLVKSEFKPFEVSEKIKEYLSLN